MSTRSLQEAALGANRDLDARGLAYAQFGNVSCVDRDAGVLAIKPSGVPYTKLCVDDMSVVSLASGECIGGLRPSSDTPTHLELYRAFDSIGGIAHTHSTFATAWAQAQRPIPCFGTTHADHVHGPVPCTRALTDEECGDGYERATGEVIVGALEGRDPLDVPAALVASHGAFAWGTSPEEAVEHAAALEVIAQLAFNAVVLDAALEPIPGALLDRHFLRKHGKTAYYGQR